MSDADFDPQEIERKVLDLAEAMDRVKARQADRDDVVVDMKEAQRSRLELLARDLQPVFDKLAKDNDQFEFALAPGEPPRLWIDITSFVRMGRDRRRYEFIKDTRLGRTVLFASDSKEQMGQAVTDYVAERILERERAIEGDWLQLKDYRFDEEGKVVSSEEPAPQQVKQGRTWSIAMMFLFGALVGAIGMVAWAWFGTLPAL